MTQPSVVVLAIAGRVLLLSLFVLGGINKVMNYSETLAIMGQAGVPAANVILPLTILLELGGGLWAISGRFAAYLPLVTLAAYTVAVNVVFHPFWALHGEQAAIELSLFFKNISIMGGLLVLCAYSLQKQPDGHRTNHAA